MQNMQHVLHKFRVWSHTGVMDYDEACFMHLTPGFGLWVYRRSVPYAQKDPRFLSKKRRGQPRGILVSHLNNRSMVVHYPRTV